MYQNKFFPQLQYDSCYAYELTFPSQFVIQEEENWTVGDQKWGDKLPKFNTPESKAELKAFTEQISQECGIPKINFTEEGIAQHIKTFFNEQRRYQKSKNPALNRVCVSIKFYNQQ